MENSGDDAPKKGRKARSIQFLGSESTATEVSDSEDYSRVSFLEADTIPNQHYIDESTSSPDLTSASTLPPRIPKGRFLDSTPPNTNATRPTSSTSNASPNSLTLLSSSTKVR